MTTPLLNIVARIKDFGATPLSCLWINHFTDLLPHNSRNCQRVKGAKTTLEYIIYDTENDNNYDDFSQSHVFTNKVKLKVFLEFTTVITKVRYVHAFCNIDIYIT
jgi:hypothetical protein